MNYSGYNNAIHSSLVDRHLAWEDVLHDHPLSYDHVTHVYDDYLDDHDIHSDYVHPDYVHPYDMHSDYVHPYDMHSDYVHRNYSHMDYYNKSDGIYLCRDCAERLLR